MRVDILKRSMVMNGEQQFYIQLDSARLSTWGLRLVVQAAWRWGLPHCAFLACPTSGACQSLADNLMSKSPSTQSHCR